MKEDSAEGQRDRVTLTMTLADGWCALCVDRKLVAVVMAMIVGSGCVRFGFEEPGDGPGRLSDAALSDGDGNGPGDSRDGPLDGPSGDDLSDGPEIDVPSKDGPPKLDGSKPPGKWVTVPKGTFTMGSPPSEPCRYSNEGQHQVTLTLGFEMQSTAVTQVQFQTLMGYNPSFFGPSGSGTNCGANCPVEDVNWHESVAYCNRLSQQAGQTPCYTCSGSGASVICQDAAAYSGQKIYTCPGYRLPTEAEWEHACRAGTQTAYYSGTNNADRCFSCSQKDANADKIGWYCANAGGTTHPVGQKQANAWGLHDMGGNTWDWCHDRYQADLGSSAVTDPWGPSSGSHRVVRGGSWYHDALSMRAAIRYNPAPTIRYNDVGFRCARTK